MWRPNTKKELGRGPRAEDGEEAGEEGVDGEEEEREDGERLVRALLRLRVLVVLLGPLAEDGDLPREAGRTKKRKGAKTTPRRRTSMRHWFAATATTPRKTPMAKPVWNLRMTTVPPTEIPMQMIAVQTAANPPADVPLSRCRSASTHAEIIAATTSKMLRNQA